MAHHEALQGFGGRLKTALQRSGVNQSELARRLRVSRAVISHWISGERECPPERVGQIAQALRIDVAYLSGGYMPGAEENMMADAMWTFRPAPRDGGRDYGNANVFATPPDVPTLVRETGQNSADQRIHAKAHVRYTLIELHRNHRAYSSFFDALEFTRLRHHMEAAGRTESRIGRKLRSALQRLDARDVVRLLRVDDFGTTGLFGAERSSGEENPFAALVRNNLDSSKSSSTAGGSFGLGKATLWRCSDLSTVLFSSSVDDDHGPSHPEGLRFIAKAEFTWHEIGDDRYAGPGWLAREENTESLWVPPSMLEPFFLDRAPVHGVADSMATGTSALIVGFTDPSADRRDDIESLAKRIVEAAAVNFWPGIVDGELDISVATQINDRVESDEVVAPESTDVAPFVEALQRHRAEEIGATSDEGETVRAGIQLRVPATKPEATSVEPGQSSVDADCALLARLASPDDVTNKTYLDTVALVRGRGMVVRYWSRANIVVGGKPFHGILLTGQATGNGPAQTAAEEFLRLSEPPAHHRWEITEDLRDNYEWGAGRRIQEMFDDATRELRRLIRPESESTDAEPEELKRLLSLSVPNREPVPATLNSVQGALIDGRWVVEGTIRVLDRTEPLSARLALSVEPESGAGIPLDWSNITIDRVNRGGAVVQPDGAIDIDRRTTSVQFSATSADPADGVDLARCKVDVKLRARKRSNREVS